MTHCTFAAHHHSVNMLLNNILCYVMFCYMTKSMTKIGELDAD